MPITCNEKTQKNNQTNTELFENKQNNKTKQK